jgi:hypothetical protein
MTKPGWSWILDPAVVRRSIGSIETSHVVRSLPPLPSSTLVRGKSVGVGGGRSALVIGCTSARIWRIACSTCSRASPALALIEPVTSNTLGLCTCVQERKSVFPQKLGHWIAY